MALNEYLRQAQRFIRDPTQSEVNPDDLKSYANRARRLVALKTQCLRILPPISSAITSLTITTPGSGYTAPTLVISQPDFPSSLAPYPSGAQATGVVQQIGGRIVNADITFGGSGYFQPIVTVSDPTGTGAVLSANLTRILDTTVNQEVYPFSNVDLSQFPGLGMVHMVKSVSIIYTNYRYSLPIYPFTTYQAFIRQYPFQYSYVPTCGSQFGQGAAGSFFLYPLSSQPYQMEWDCFCTPSDLETDFDVEALPYPWTDAVPYFMAHLAYLEMQNLNAAKFYEDLFDKYIRTYSQAARPGRVTNPYGRP